MKILFYRGKYTCFRDEKKPYPSAIGKIFRILPIPESGEEIFKLSMEFLKQELLPKRRMACPRQYDYSGWTCGGLIFLNRQP
jgi:hypothetical protein